MNNNEIKNNYISFYTPINVYIPFDNLEKLKLRKNHQVYAGELLGTMNGNTNIYSSVSGIIKGTANIQANNTMVNCLVVENDYKDKRIKISGGKRVFDNYKRKDANDILDLYNLSRKYNTKKNLIVDFLCTSNNLNNRVISIHHAFEILETIDAISTIYNLDNAYIVVNDNTLLNTLKRYSRMYPKIKFIKKINKNEDSVYYNAYEILKIYNVLKFNKKLNEKYITLVYNKKTIIIKSKLNMLVSELLKSFKIEYKKIDVINNENILINNYNGIISENIESIIVT